MSTRLREATGDDFQLIKNLVPYYIYEMSGFMGWPPSADGRYDGCDDLPDYWEKPDHHPYVILKDREIAGFALVRQYLQDKSYTEVGEFFVIRKFQRKRVGADSAFQLFDSQPGRWLVRVLDINHAARAFWTRVIDEYAAGCFTQTAEQYVCPHSGPWPMQYYRFESRGD